MHRAFWIPALAALCACTPPGDASDDTDSTAQVETLDVSIPDPEPDPEMIDFLSPPLDIQPYSDHMFCFYMEPLAEDVAADNLEAYQGQYGHHIVVLSSKVAKEPGTFEDCSDADQMPNLRPMVLPDTPLQAGYGILLRAGTQPVMQVHYVNPTAKVLHTRDVARLHVIDPDTVTTWASTFATNQDAFSLPPGQSTTVTFDCDLPENVTLLLFGGHMHEWGTRFETLIGTSDDDMHQQYLVDPWVPEFRDAPPVDLHFENPMAIAAGTKIRTSCTWYNDQSEAIDFPHEMCSTFGYLGNTQDPYICEVRE